MKNIQSILLLLVVLLMFTACKDESLGPILTFDNATKGAYIRVINQTDNTVNLDDIDNSTFTYSVEFVDLKKGELVSAYNLQVAFEDKDASNGNMSTEPREILAWSSGDFTTSKAGFKSLENIQISAKEIVDFLGIQAENISYGDNFKFTGSITTTEGAVYTGANSSASVNGAGFRGFFNFTLTARCPTDLAGTYEYTTFGVDVTCSDTSKTSMQDLSGTIEITSAGNGIYRFSDWSFGAFSVCYGVDVVEKSSGLQFADYCDNLTYPGKKDSFGDTWTFDSAIEGTKWTINWKTTAGDSGKTVLTNPNGWGLVVK